MLGPPFMVCSSVFAQIPTHRLEMCCSPFCRFAIRDRGNGVIPAVVPPGQADDREHLDDLAVGIVSAQFREVPRFDQIRHKRPVPRKPQRGSLGFRELRGVLERPDIANPVRVDTHHVERVCAMSLAMLTATGDAGHREELAAQLPRQIAGSDHYEFDKALKPLQQLRPAEELEVLPILVFGIRHVPFAAYRIRLLGGYVWAA